MGTVALKKKNFASSTLIAGITNVATSLTVATGHGTKFPATGNFRAVLWDAQYDNPAKDANAEIVQASLSSGDTFNITRGQESTSGYAWSSGANFALTPTAGVFDEVDAAINDNDSRITVLETFKGALINKSAGGSIPSGSWTSLTFDTEQYDTDAWHSTVTNTDRLTVPSGVSKVRLCAQAGWASSATGARGLRIIKNADSAPAIGLPNLFLPGQTGGNSLNVQSSVIDVTPGDYFRLQAYQASGAGLDLLTPTWFAIEVVA